MSLTGINKYTNMYAQKHMHIHSVHVTSFIFSRSLFPPQHLLIVIFLSLVPSGNKGEGHRKERMRKGKRGRL